MIFIDSLYTSNQGGDKILLDYLVKVLEDREIDTFYLFDERCRDSFVEVPEERKVFLQAGLRNRERFYKMYKNKFAKILCFSNIPPMTRTRSEVYTYFHQTMYLNIPMEFSLKDRLLFRLKQNYLKLFKRNSDCWLVQNAVIQSELSQKYNIKEEQILLRPFYPNEDLMTDDKSKITNTFIFVSNALPHKNHQRLFDAFVRFYDEYKTGELLITVSESAKTMYDLIANLQKKGYPIVNLGFVNRKELIKNYQKVEYLIFPSLEESLGLGIVEAIECGCKVIGADLPYMHQVCQPSISFNPYDVEDIKNAFKKAIKKEETITKQKIFNQIDDMIALLES